MAHVSPKVKAKVSAATSVANMNTWPVIARFLRARSKAREAKAKDSKDCAMRAVSKGIQPETAQM